jgi:hypothetical protein
MSQASIFISHINEEHEVASSLKEYIESSFLGMVECFVSSDREGIKYGNQWMEILDEQIKKGVIPI